MPAILQPLAAARATTGPSARLALVLSLVLHSLFVVLVFFIPANERQPAPAPLLVNTCVLLADPPLQPRGTLASEGGALEPQEAVQPVIFPDPTPDPVPGQGAPTALAVSSPVAPGGGTDSRPGRGGPAFFQVPARGERIIYVIDRSVSMGINGGLTAAKHELLACLEQLPDSARFQVICYNREADLLRLDGRTELLPVNAATRQAVAHFLASLRAAGSTNHLEALRRALALQPDVIFLVTDADDLTFDQVRIVTQWNGAHAVVHTIELSDRARECGESPLSLLARNNRGSYRVVVLDR